MCSYLCDDVLLFSVECSQITAVSNNGSLLPTENIVFSSILVTMDISGGWCVGSSDLSPNVNLTFTMPLYLLHAIVRGYGSNYVSDFSLIYENASSERVTYTNVDGDSVRQSLNSYTYT